MYARERISAESVSPRRVISTQHDDDDDDECRLISCGERRERTRTAVSRSNCRPALYLGAALLRGSCTPALVRAKSLVVIGSLDDLIARFERRFVRSFASPSSIGEIAVEFASTSFYSSWDINYVLIKIENILVTIDKSV